MAKQGGDQDIESITLSARVDALVKLGLDKYGEGDLVGALSEWEHALSLDPEATQALEYIEYVRQNFAQLEQQFAAAREAAAAAKEAGVPFVEGGALELELDGDAYDAFELDGDSAAQLEEWIDSASVDEGWVLDDFAPAAPLPPSPLDDGLGAGDTGRASGVVGVDGGQLGDGAVELAEDRVAAVDAPADDEADFGALNALLDDSLPELEPELELELEPAPASGAAEQGSVGELELPDEDEMELTVPGGDEPPPLPERPAISDEALAAFDVDRALEPATRDAGVPGTDVPADFDLGEVARLDGALRDDRIVEPDQVADVRVTFHDLGTGEATMPARPSQTNLELPDELELGASGAMPSVGRTETEDGLEETVERNAARALWSLSFDEEGAPDDEGELTRERQSDALGLGELGINVDLPAGGQRAPTMDPALDASELMGHDEPGEGMDFEATREHRALPDNGLDLDFGAEPMPTATGKHKRAVITGGAERGPQIDAMRMEVVAAQIDREIDAGVPVEESDDDRTRRRVGALIERAEREFQKGHAPTAVAALDLALEERPESAIAQKLVHQYRELLFKIYEAYIGDDSRTPIVALPMHEIALQELDNRAAFLLSRIDGMLTFEEILDVSGMSRLEAYRHLSRLLLRGILEVR